MGARDHFLAPSIERRDRVQCAGSCRPPRCWTYQDESWRKQSRGRHRNVHGGILSRVGLLERSADRTAIDRREPAGTRKVPGRPGLHRFPKSAGLVLTAAMWAASLWRSSPQPGAFGATMLSAGFVNRGASHFVVIGLGAGYFEVSPRTRVMCMCTSGRIFAAVRLS